MSDSPRIIFKEVEEDLGGSEFNGGRVIARTLRRVVRGESVRKVVTVFVHRPLGLILSTCFRVSSYPLEAVSRRLSVPDVSKEKVRGFFPWLSGGSFSKFEGA
jgi:hypothetical protein